MQSVRLKQGGNFLMIFVSFWEMISQCQVPIELPLLEAINKLLDACTHYATESQLSHIEVCIQHVEETVAS